MCDFAACCHGHDMCIDAMVCSKGAAEQKDAQTGATPAASGAAGSSAARSVSSCPAGQASSGSRGSGSGDFRARLRACASSALSWTPGGGSAIYIAPEPSVNSKTYEGISALFMQTHKASPHAWTMPMPSSCTLDNIPIQ